MKICLISTFFDPELCGGTETYLRTLAQNISVEDQVVVICTTPRGFRNYFRPRRETHDQNLVVYRFRPINIFDFRDLKNHTRWQRAVYYLFDLFNVQSAVIIGRIIRRERPDIVHTNNTYSLSPLCFRTIPKHTPHVHMLHDYQLLEPGGAMLNGDRSIKTRLTAIERIFLYFKRWCIDGVDLVIAPSKFILDLHKHYGYFSHHQTLVIPLGVEIKSREMSATQDKQFTVLYIGQLTKQKGIEVLLQAIKQSPNHDIRYVICGTGPLADRLHEEAKQNENIILAGFVDGQQKDTYFHEASVVVLPSIWYDNSPVVIYESFSYGHPVIASAIGGIPELVDASVGRLVPVGDAAALSRAIDHFYRSPDELRTLSESARIKSESLTFTRHYQHLHSLYLTLHQSR